MRNDFSHDSPYFVENFKEKYGQRIIKWQDG